MKHYMVTLPFPILKSKGKYCMAEKPSHVSRVSLSHLVETGLNIYVVTYLVSVFHLEPAPTPPAASA
jgi:hypothetical protein